MKDAQRRPGEIEVSAANGATVVRPEGGRLDLEVAAAFRSRLQELIARGHRNLVIDLAEVSFLDSSGLGALISALKLLKTSKERRRGERRRLSRPSSPRRQKSRGDLRLAAAQPSVVSLLEVIRLDRVFPSYPSVDAAVRSYEA
jgi:anti-sigma B factor antagonist